MKFTHLALGLALAGLSFGANATNGMFGHGYGMKAKGMGGAATASSDDAFGGANNPASMAFAGNRMDIGADVFMPIREANRVGSTPGLFPAINADSESESNVFLIPEFGYNRMINPNLALGVTVYGNGGMNTDYDPIPGSAGVCGPAETNFFCGQGRLGIDLMQLIIAPTAAYKLNANHSIGISPLLAYQRFKAEGLQAFGVMTPTGGNIGYDNSFGYGVRVGYFGKITPTVTIGAAYSSKVNYDEFSDYNMLFAEQGDLDIPENYNVGIAWQATPQVKLALDYQRINYSDVDAMGNPVSNVFGCPIFGGGNLANCFGGSAGPGFGWGDADVWKLGVEYKHNNQWTFRGGYSHTNSPIESSNTFGSPDFGEAAINILAPGIIEDHVTLGFTYTLASGNELTMSYMHAFTNEVSGADPFFNGLATIKMHQNSIGIAYGWKM